MQNSTNTAYLSPCSCIVFQHPSSKTHCWAKIPNNVLLVSKTEINGFFLQFLLFEQQQYRRGKYPIPMEYIVYIIYFALIFPFLDPCEKVAFLRTYELHLLQNAHTTCTCFASFRIFEVGIFKSLKIDRDILKFTSCCFL